MQLLPNIAHVWSINLNINNKIEQQYLSTFNAEERNRAERFHQAAHRQHFIAARGALRQLLACYLKTQPGSLIFNYNEYKKPFVISPNMPIYFNISHSHDLALAAFTCNNEVGVDLEKMEKNI